MVEGEPFDSGMNGDLLIGADKGEYPSSNQKGKWKSLEHRGVTFFPGYEPHGVKLLYKVSFEVLIIELVKFVCNMFVGRRT